MRRTAKGHLPLTRKNKRGQSVCQNHCFVGGNKRVAFAASAIFLRMNGYRLSVEADDGETFLVNHVIQKRMAIEDIATWLESRMKRVDQD